MSKEVYVRYTAPVVVKVVIPDEPMDGPAEVAQVVVEDDRLEGPLPMIEDEVGGDAELDAGERELVMEALDGENSIWPAWEFGW